MMGWYSQELSRTPVKQLPGSNLMALELRPAGQHSKLRTFLAMTGASARFIGSPFYHDWLRRLAEDDDCDI